MGKQIQILVFTFILFALTKYASGVTAYPYPVNINQTDGTRITIILKGDEFVKWARTVDGYSIMRNTKGIFEYAVSDSKGDMAPSGIAARNESERSLADNQFLGKVQKGLIYSTEQIRIMKSIAGMYKKGSQKSFSAFGSKKLVCILIGFQDKGFTKNQTEFTNLFNQVGYITGGAAGSVRDYYTETSYKQLDLTVTVAGPYTAANNMNFYGANNSTDDDVRPRELVTEAVNLADAAVNYADFDNDNDGTVDGVYVIYAGFGEEAGGDADCIWAHAWEISPVTKDGKKVISYSCSPELRGNSGSAITHIGVICHEFGHVLGASDFYDTDYETSGSYTGTGNWDLMADGSWNNDGISPAHQNPYTKIYVFGWATATTLTTGTNITLSNAAQNRTSFYRVNTSTANEYFLIENRQQLQFDGYIPGHGMIIYHVDGTFIEQHLNNNDINAGSHQGMYPVCASATGNPPSTYGVIDNGGLPYPGTGHKTSFTDTTIPSSKSWAGSNTALPLLNISENSTAKTISFGFIINTTTPVVATTSFSSIGSTTAISGGNVTADGGAAITSKGVCWSTSSGPTAALLTKTSDGNGIGIFTSNITGLTAGTTYYARAYATSSAETGYGTEIRFVANSLTPPLAKPATNVLQTTLYANWSSTASATGYRLDMSTSNLFTTFVSGFADKDVGNVTSFQITGLTAKTTYYYRIRAYNTGGTGFNSNILTVKTLSVASVVPEVLTASSCNVKVTLSWGKSTGSDFTRYRIYGGTSTNPVTKIDSSTTSISDTFKILTGLTRGRVYYFRVTAVNLDGAESAFSIQKQVTVITGIIPVIKAKWGDVLICSDLKDSISSYQWLYGSSKILNAVNQYYASNKKAGSYSVEIIDKNGCKNSSNIVSISGTKSLSVYPNPASESFALRLNEESEGKAVIRLLNSSGIKVMELQTKKGSEELLKEIPVSNLDKGIYIVQVLMNDKELYSVKIIVSK